MIKSSYLIIIVFLVFHSASVFCQNVGIGTTTPSEKLQVEGNILLDTAKLNAIQLATNAGAGKILTSDVLGNGSWEELVIPPPDDPADPSGNVGYGVWGDCATNGNISDYLPVTDTVGAVGDFFGTSVAMSGDFAIVGAPLDDEAILNQGSVSIYHFNGTGWDFVQKLTDPSGANGDRFGNSVAISGDYAIVGSNLDAGAFTTQGSASIFHYNGSTWEWLVKLTDPNGAANDQFGYSVSLSGGHAMVGTPFDDEDPMFLYDKGAVFAYHLNGTNWTFVEKLTDAFGSIGDQYGYSVSVSNNYLIIGSIKDDVNGNGDAGSANTYEYNGTNWVLKQKITDPGGLQGDFFGGSVSMAFPFAVAGAYGDNVGANTSQGSVSVFRYNAGSWGYVQKLSNVTGLSNDLFGLSVDLSDHYLLVGARGDDIGTYVDQGSMSIFQRIGFGWQQLQFVSEPGGNPNDFFGIFCAVDETTKRFVVGASNYLSNTGKVVFGKIK